MIDTVEKVRKAEHRTRSELVREALRTYFMLAGRAYTPTRAELHAIERGRAAIRRGSYFTLKEFRAYVGGESKKARAKKRPPRPSS
jgi:predicted transcriptional regulator